MEEARRRAEGGFDRQWGWYRGIASWHALCVPSNDERLAAPCAPFPGVGMILRSHEYSTICARIGIFIFGNLKILKSSSLSRKKSTNHFTLDRKLMRLRRKSMNLPSPPNRSPQIFCLILIIFIIYFYYRKLTSLDVITGKITECSKNFP